MEEDTKSKAIGGVAIFAIILLFLFLVIAQILAFYKLDQTRQLLQDQITDMQNKLIKLVRAINTLAPSNLSKLKDSVDDI